MPNQTEQPVLLFSYGTLQDQAVQLSTFGRRLNGRSDNLPGYKQNLVEITDPAVLAASGKTHHPIVQESADLSDEITGTVFQITAQELVAADEYEVADYKRVRVTLKSGTSAWVYVRA
ncbi:gamma-glutamylcyclotransferase [Pseudomonas sp. B21-015]|uniref:gamma-glutamylcyclotransferase family protein n=1 Tax=Pseudomonas sp. B21-015 TaxID=2895473 RepID=UPI00215FFB0D|nr:gamma-glutamylcyclotransferase family protein [Pseudomonas sp. B21-015]UVM51549.1 gamma-glutamylcyclotransferase [Pseudomonas sp. B21-015]